MQGTLLQQMSKSRLTEAILSLGSSVNSVPSVEFRTIKESPFMGYLLAEDPANVCLCART